jgi:hypothetical protein
LSLGIAFGYDYTVGLRNEMRLIDDQRETTYKTILGIAIIVVVWAVAHDQYLVRIAPEHFTEYHAPLWQIENPSLLAFLYAFGASISPGLLLGIAVTYFGRKGSVNRIPHKKLILGSILVVIATEFLSAGTGLIVFLNKEVFYPSDWFPVSSLPIAVTQTIQITAYIGASLFSALFLVAIYFRRRAKQAKALKL